VVLKGSAGKYLVKNGTDVYFNFEGKDASTSVIKLRVRDVPYTFEGVPVAETLSKTVEYTINKLTTANSFELLDASGAEINNKLLYILGGKQSNTTNFKLVVNHEKGLLSNSSITLKSNNPNITFINGLSEISLNHKGIVVDNSKANSLGITIFTIGLNSSKVGENATITAIAGDESVGVNAELKVESVNAVESLTNIDITSEDVTYCRDLSNNYNDEDVKYFSIVQNKLVDFEIKINNVSNNIKEIMLSTNSGKNYEKGLANNNLSYDVLSPSKFSVKGANNKTQILDLKIKYYHYVDGVISVVEKDIELRIATCSSIHSIYATPNKTEIAYINSKYEDVAMVEISFFSLDVSGYQPSETLNFGNDKTEVRDVSGIKLSLDNIDISSDRNNINVYLSVDGTKVLLANDQDGVERLIRGIDLTFAGKRILEGTIILEIKNQIETEDIRVNLTPKYLDVDLTPVSVKIDCIKQTHLVIWVCFYLKSRRGYVV